MQNPLQTLVRFPPFCAGMNEDFSSMAAIPQVMGTSVDAASGVLLMQRQKCSSGSGQALLSRRTREESPHTAAKGKYDQLLLRLALREVFTAPCQPTEQSTILTPLV